MGEAIAAGLVTSETIDAGRIVVAEPSAERREVFERNGIGTVADGHEVVASAEVVLLAVKPQVIDAVLAHLADDITPATVVVSIAAGVTCARLESLLDGDVPVVRVMPNTPAMVGEGMAIVSGGSFATVEQLERVRVLFDAVGVAIVLDEKLQDAAAAISGCGPAYMAIFVDALARAGVREGLPRDVAQALAIQTMRGTATMLAVTRMHPEEAVDAVTSPGGTTIAAVAELERGGLRSAVFDAVSAAVLRARELGS